VKGQPPAAAGSVAAPDTLVPRVIGIVGAGRMGSALASLAAGASIRVLVTKSATTAPPREGSENTSLLVEGASLDDVIGRSEAVVLALPYDRVETLPALAFRGALVIDAMNAWPPPRKDNSTESRSGLRERGTSVSVERFLRGAHVVKALNHLSYRDLATLSTPRGSPNRVAVPIAGDRTSDLLGVAALIDSLGYDCVVAGALEDGLRMEPGSEAFGLIADKARLREALSRRHTAEPLDSSLEGTVAA